MPFELIREYIMIDQEVSSFDTQTSIEEMIKIPEYKPNMRKVLTVNGEVDVGRQSVDGSVLVIEGDISYKILYAAEGGYLECANALVPFEYSVELDKLDGDLECCIKTNLEHVDFRLTNSRKINIRSIMEIGGKVIKKSSFPLLKDVKEMKNIQKLENKLIITKSFMKSNEQQLIKDKVNIEENDETALKLIDTQFTFIDTKANKSPSGILVNGKIYSKALYSVENEGKREYKHQEHIIGFSQFIEKTGVENIDNYLFVPNIKNATADFVINKETNEISLDIELMLSTNVIFYENINIENIQDLYSPEIKTEIKKETVSTSCLVNSYEEGIKISEEILNSSQLPIEKILHISGNALITDLEKTNKSIEIEGVLNTNIIYKLDSEEQLIESVEKQMPFSYTINTSQEGDVLSDFDVLIEGMDCTVKNSNMTVDASLCLKGNLLESVVLNKVEEIEEIVVEEEIKEGEYYSIKAYYKQPSESLWQIAKENGTTIEKILKDNNIESEDKVHDYTPLIILK